MVGIDKKVMIVIESTVEVDVAASRVHIACREVIQSLSHWQATPKFRTRDSS